MITSEDIKLYRTEAGVVDAIGIRVNKIFQMLPLVDGVFDEINPLTVQLREYEQEHGAIDLSPIYPFTLEEKKADLLNQNNAEATQRLDALTAGRSPNEVATWSLKQAESAKYLETETLEDVPVLALEAQVASGAKTVAQRKAATKSLAQHILTQAQPMREATARIIGTRSLVAGKIASLDSLEAAIGFDVLASWMS